jgi:choline kinase/DNA-binding XRE family transcriptional regulator
MLACLRTYEHYKSTNGFMVRKKRIRFGDYIREHRIGKGIGQRELARQLGISASYLNDIEKSNRVAPNSKTVRAMIIILDVDLERAFDLAGRSRNALPADVVEIVEENSEIIPLLRAISAYGLTARQVKEVKDNIMAKETNVIVIAAGMGNRMQPLTEGKPKCMLEFGGRTLLQRQLDAYAACGLSRIALIRGYKKEKIAYDGITYYDNPDYENNNILNSLFCAEPEINGHVIVAYSDILFESHIVERLLQSEADISVVVDIDWRDYYVGRKDHPIEEAENVILDANNNVVEIGKILTGKNDVHGEFIGMMKFSPRGAEVFKKHFNRAKALFAGKPFQHAAVFEKAYLTDLIQEMIDLGTPIHCVIIERGWKEIDTVEDYEKALKAFDE